MGMCGYFVNNCVAVTPNYVTVAGREEIPSFGGTNHGCQPCVRHPCFLASDVVADDEIFWKVLARDDIS